MIRRKAVAVDWKKISACNLERRKSNKDRRNDVKENSSYMEGMEERVWRCNLERRRNRDARNNYKEKKRYSGLESKKMYVGVIWKEESEKKEETRIEKINIEEIMIKRKVVTFDWKRV